MGRRRNPIKRLQEGCLYFVDRRHDYFPIYRKIISRQESKNLGASNKSYFPIKDSPTVTTVMVTGHEVFFGREYVKVLAANSTQDTSIGYMELKEFLRVITGTPSWVYLPAPQ